METWLSGEYSAHSVWRQNVLQHRKWGFACTVDMRLCVYSLCVWAQGAAQMDCLYLRRP